jgi:hypothetical protein
MALPGAPRQVGIVKRPSQMRRTEFPRATKSQRSFRLTICCDRIAFARGSRGNRTARRLSGENGGKTCQRRQAGHFLQSDLR